MPVRRLASSLALAQLSALLCVGCVNLTPPWETVTSYADSAVGGAVAWDSGRSSAFRDAVGVESELAGTGGAMGLDGGVGLVGDRSSDGSAGAVSHGGDTGSGAGGTVGSGGIVGSGGTVGAGGAAATDALAATDQAAPAGPDGKDGVGPEVGDAGRDAPSDPKASPTDGSCPLCSLGRSLLHRYSFNGTGTKVTDSVGTADGTVVDAQLSGSGTVALAGGGSGQHIKLPNHLLSSLTNATLEGWVTWAGGGNNQRILDFGSNDLIAGKYQATTTVIISPNSAPQGIPPRLRASYSNQVSLVGTFADASSTLPTGTMSHVVAVFDNQRHMLLLYLNGALCGQTTGLGSLSLINDVNNWLGRSQYSDDPGFSGTYHEFRIYGAALTADEIRASYAAGPDAVLGG